MMTLSEAIRLGATLCAQTRGRFRTPGGRRSCALGAAIEAMGLQWRPAIPGNRALDREGNDVEATGTVLTWPKEWAKVFNTVIQCPLCPRSDIVKIMIPHLNDHHRWTREQIADFVATVEARTPTTQEETQVHA